MTEEQRGFVWFLVAVIMTTTKKQVGEERVYFSSQTVLIPVTKGGQSGEELKQIMEDRCSPDHLPKCFQFLSI